MLGEDKALLIDARGHRCPVPTLRLARALAEAPTGAVLVLLADDPLARIDIPHFAAQQGCQLVALSDEGAALRFTLRKR